MTHIHSASIDVYIDAKANIQNLFLKIDMKITNFRSVCARRQSQELCLLVFSYELLYIEFAPQLLQQCTSIHVFISKKMNVQLCVSRGFSQLHRMGGLHRIFCAIAYLEVLNCKFSSVHLVVVSHQFRPFSPGD